MRIATPLVPKPTGHAPRRRPASEIARLLEERKRWVGKIDPAQHFHKLLDLLPGVYFFAKNQRGETMFSSRNILDLYGMSDEREMIGLTDFDLNPDRMAQGYVNDDARIYDTGEPILNRFELWFNRQGVPDWHVVHKLPIRSRRGEIIGIMGILQSYSGQCGGQWPFAEITAAVERIRREFAKPLRIHDLARDLGLSPRQLQRRFRETLGLTPRQLLLKTRVLAATRALAEGRLSLVEISSNCGFCDQSSFIQHFRRQTGVTPSVFRNRSRNARDLG